MKDILSSHSDPAHRRCGSHAPIRKERPKDGVEKARQAGVYKGRPATIGTTKLRELHAAGVGPSDIANQLGIGRASVYPNAPRGHALLIVPERDVTAEDDADFERRFKTQQRRLQANARSAKPPQLCHPRQTRYIVNMSNRLPRPPKKVQFARKCVFCEVNNANSREHFYSEWMHELLPLGPEGKYSGETIDEHPKTRVVSKHDKRAKPGELYTKQLKVVC